MPSITITITMDVPDGTDVSLDAEPDATAAVDDATGLPVDVQTLVERYVPTRYREYTVRYLNACIDDLDCVVEVPSSQDRQHEYLNIFPPPRCRRARVGALTYSSTRTALYTGAIDLSEFQVAEETTNNGVYVHPKVAQLDSDAAVTEAIELTRRAVARLER